MKVIATEPGFHNNQRYSTGDSFDLLPLLVPAYEPKLVDNKPVVINGVPQYTTKRLSKDGVPQFRTVSIDEQFASEWMEKVPDTKPPVAAKATADKKAAALKTAAAETDADGNQV